ncbi:MAG: peptidoglycan editing factor PgeF [Prevotella sp.]|nr:peptidoglycan editing factor PgeF [Prevotella sp.]
MQKPQLIYYNIDKNVVAFSSTRHGGKSKGNYGEFNINYYCGDTQSAIEANRKALCDELKIKRETLIYPHQVHQTEIRQITKGYLALPDNVKRMFLEGVDALITDVVDICIGVSTADCIPVLIYDSEHHVAAAVHAGWRGTVAGIVLKTVALMRSTYQSQPLKMKAVIGPGISLKHFEVGDEVYHSFAEVGFDMEIIAKRYEKWHIDLPLCNKIQLEEAGLSAENIQSSSICTYEHVDDYFSARRLGIDSGRIFTGLILK